MGHRKGIPNKKGSKIRVNGGGYLIQNNILHPTATKKGLVLVHRMIAYDAGLLKDLKHHVHHKNGIKTDNRLENLEVLTPQEHNRIHSENGGRKWTEEEKKNHDWSHHPNLGKPMPLSTRKKISAAKILRADQIGRRGWIDQNGYKMLKREKVAFMEHRKIAEDFLGRKLKKTEKLTHLNGVRADNRLENLCLEDFGFPPTLTKEVAKLKKAGVTWDEMGRIFGTIPRRIRAIHERSKSK